MKGGTFRRIADGFKRLMGRPITTTYKDPVTPDPRDRRKKRSAGTGSGRFHKTSRKRLCSPPCRPGTLAYHDKLVRHFGARFAMNFRRRFIASRKPMGPELVIPTDEDFAANPPWAFLSTGTG